MSYHIDAENISLDDLRERIEATDLVPSRASLTKKIREKMKALEKQGIKTLASLRHELKNSKRLAAVAEVTGIDTQYLIILRREVESYIPKPVALKIFDWLPKNEIVKHERNGIGDTATLYEMTNRVKKRTELAKSTGVDIATLEIFARLADLMRVQWVSPTFASLIVTFIRPDPNMRIGLSFLIQILKFQKRGPVLSLTKSCASTLYNGLSRRICKSGIRSLCLLYWVF